MAPAPDRTAGRPLPVQAVGIGLPWRFRVTSTNQSCEGFASAVKQRFEPALHPLVGRQIEALRGVAQSRVDSVVRRLRRAAREYGKEVDSYIPCCLSLKDLPAMLFAG